MPKLPAIVPEIVSLSVLLLMTLALIAGQAESTWKARAAASEGLTVPALIQQFERNFDHQLGEHALSVSIGLVTNLSPFRGEDE